MSKRKNRLSRFRQSSKNVSLSDLMPILDEYGFVLERIEGSHHHFSYILYGQKKLMTIPLARPLNSVYVKQVIKIIDQIIAEKRKRK